MKYLLLLILCVSLYKFSHGQGCVTDYVDPSFQLTKTDPGCAANSGSIELSSQQGGVGPFTYTLVELSLTNSTGSFTGLAAGAYTVQFRDACGTVRTRQLTLVPYQFSFDFTIDKVAGCNGGNITIDPVPASASYEYGVVNLNGDTTWSSVSSFDITLMKTLKIILKDACGNLQVKAWTAPLGYLPYISEIQHNIQCDKMDLFPIFYGFDKPSVCLYKSDGTLYGCKQGNVGPDVNFYNVPWGNYYFIVKDSCFRDSLFQPSLESFGGSQLDPHNWDCNSFWMHVDGPPPPAAWYAANDTIQGSPDSICLFNATTNQLVSCKAQGDTTHINPRSGLPWPSGAVWENLPYGSYYAYIYDPCMDSTFRIDSTVVYPFDVQATAYAHCDYSNAVVQTVFDPASKAPYSVSIYYPDGNLASQFTNNVPRITNVFTAYLNGGTLKVVAEDGCGNKDTSYVQQAALTLNKSFTVDQKCPGLNGAGGSGDIIIDASVVGNGARPVPTIIKVNGNDVTINYSYVTDNNGNYQFLFPNLPTGVYIMKYGFNSCSSNTILDTIEVKDYIYPYQDTLQISQCAGNPVTFSNPVIGGLAPYTYQIISSLPALPSLITSVQPVNTFTIGTGVAYQSIKVRAIDRCGNSAIGDVMVTPIPLCDLVLPVDSIEKNALIKNQLAKVFPNPSHNYFTISISQRKKADYRIEITNSNGIKVYEKVLSNVDKINHDVQRIFVPGLYLISVTELGSGRRSVFKQVIQ